VKTSKRRNGLSRRGYRMRLAVQVLLLVASAGQFVRAEALTLPEQSISSSAARQEDSTTAAPSQGESFNPLYESAALVLCGSLVLLVAHKIRKSSARKHSETTTISFQPKSSKRVAAVSPSPEKCFAVSQASSLES